MYIHSYDVEVWKHNAEGNVVESKIINIEARNRDQAARKALKLGWHEVASVNMTG